MTTKICTGPCGETKDVTEFSMRKGSTDGYRNQCKKCRCNQTKKYHEEHKEERNEYAKKYREEHREELNEYMKKYNEENREQLLGQGRKRYEENREKMLEQNKKYREEHREELNEYAKKYREEHREKLLEQNKKYREEHREELIEYAVNYTRERLKTDPLYKLIHTLRSRIYNAIRNQYGEKAHSSMELIGCTIQEVRCHIESQFVEGMTWDNHGKWHIDHIRPCASFNLEDPEEQKKCFHFTNLQPLWAEDNLRKSDKFSDKQQSCDDIIENKQ